MNYNLKETLHTKYQLLEAMGITYWMSNATPLVSENPLFCAGCLVILPEQLPKHEVEQNNILKGMLKVLELNENELCVAWIRGGMRPVEFNLIGEAIVKWAPYHVLVMGEEFGKQLLTLGLDLSIQITYHPSELQQAKALKRKAYEDLLSLKKRLSLTRIV